jgi:CMP-N-acetylneuraminic acid synthetase
MMNGEDSDVRFLITARGGSKGVPRKNLQVVGGKPLVVRSIEAALSSPVKASVFVSTDDDEIAELSQQSGAKVIRRPSELATDSSTSESAVLHFLDSERLTNGKIVLIQPTSPFLNGDDLAQVVQCCGKFDSCLTVYESHAFLWRQKADHEVVGVNHDFRVRLRRQDMHSNEFIENGAAFGMDIAGFRRFKHRFFGRVGMVVMPKLRSLEIDSQEDLQLAIRVSDLPRATG